MNRPINVWMQEFWEKSIEMGFWYRLLGLLEIVPKTTVYGKIKNVIQNSSVRKKKGRQSLIN